MIQYDPKKIPLDYSEKEELTVIVEDFSAALLYIKFSAFPAVS
jgi:hypothetical protein